ncbi:hypothetical protein MKX03_021071, partial [Papaver bracteatum]
SNVNLGVLKLAVDLVVFFVIVCRLLPRSTTTDGGHEHIQRGNSFSIEQQEAMEEDKDEEDGEEVEVSLEKSTEEMEEEGDKDEDGEEVEVALEKSTEEMEEEEIVVEKKNEVPPISAQQEAVEKEEKADEDGEELRVVLEKSKEEEEVVEKKKEDLEEDEVEVEENENNGPHRSETKRELHHYQYHNICRCYCHITMNQKHPTVGNERRNSGSSLNPRKESFPAPEERTFDYNQVNKYPHPPLHRPDPSAPPIPESYCTQYTSSPTTKLRVDAFTSPATPSQPTLQSKRDPLPQSPPRRRIEREERRVSTQSKRAKKGESGRLRFQSGVPPTTRPMQPPKPEIAPTVQPSQSSVAQSSCPLPPPPPAHQQSFLTKLFKPNNNKKKVNLKASLPHPLADPPTSSVLQKFFKKSSQIKKVLSDAGLPPPLPPQPPAPPPSPEPPPPKKTSEQPPVPPLGPYNLHKNTRPSSRMPQNLKVPAPKDTKPCGMKRATNKGTPPLPTITNNPNTLQRHQNTYSDFKKEIYVEIGGQSPLNGIPPPPPPLPFPSRGMKFVSHGDLVNIQSSSSDSVDDLPSTPYYYSSSDINNKAKNIIPTFRAGFHIRGDTSSSSSTINPNYVNYEASFYPPPTPAEFYTIMNPIFPPSRIAV